MNTDFIARCIAGNADTTSTKNNAALVEIVDSGAKNVVQIDELGTTATHGTTYTHQGVTFVLNSDGTITVTRTDEGTEEAACNIRFNNRAFYANDYCDGKHILSGCPAGGSLETYYLEAEVSTPPVDYRRADSGNGILLREYTGDKNVIVRIRVNPDYSPDGLVFKPMICSQAAWDISKEFQPYRPSYQELYEMVLDLQT